MIWIILTFLGIPLWFCAIALGILLRGRHRVKHLPGGFGCKVRVVSGQVPGLKSEFSRITGVGHWIHAVLVLHGGNPFLARTGLCGIQLSRADRRISTPRNGEADRRPGRGSLPARQRRDARIGVRTRRSRGDARAVRTTAVDGRRPRPPPAALGGSIVTWALPAISGILLVFAAISGRVAGTPLTAPMVFTVGGLVLGAQATGLMDLEATSETVKLLAEITLALVLFSDASRVNLIALRAEIALPARLLGIGLPP